MEKCIVYGVFAGLRVKPNHSTHYVLPRLISFAEKQMTLYLFRTDRNVKMWRCLCLKLPPRYTLLYFRLMRYKLWYAISVHHILSLQNKADVKLFRSKLTCF